MTRYLLALLIIIIPFAGASGDEARLLRNPDIHGDRVVFCYAGDLWTVSSEGGTARLLTTHPGREFFPKFSPDGKQIAFSAQYDGNVDVFVMPAQGGEPKRLTYHYFQDWVVDWYPDGESILLRSIRSSFTRRFNRLHKVPAEGGFVKVLPLPEGELTSFNPDGSKIAYNRISRELSFWKRYRGGMQQDIWIYDFPNNTSERITDYEGNDTFPMWDGDMIYFISDRDKVMNIYSYDNMTKEIKQLTNYKEYDVKWPSLGPGAIIYENGGFLYVLDLDNGDPRKINVEIYDDKVAARPSIQNVSNYIHSHNISPTGARAVIEARGDIFTVPAKKGSIRNLTQSPGIRDRHPACSPDGKWIAYFSDHTGEFELYLMDVSIPSAKGEVIQLTQDSKTYYVWPVWAPDSKKILYSDAGANIYYIDVETKKVTKIDHAEHLGALNFFSGVWSPDSKWIAYSRPTARTTYSSIFLYSLEENESYQVTSDMTFDTNPCFDPEGKYLYFFAHREIIPTISPFELNFSHVLPTRIVVATLQADSQSPFPPESDEEEVEEADEDAEKTEDESAESVKDTNEEEKDEDEEKGLDVKIDLEGLDERAVYIDIPSRGAFFSMFAAKEKLYYTFLPYGGGFNEMQLNVFDLKKREKKTVITSFTEIVMSSDKKKILWRKYPSTFGIVDAMPGQKPMSGLLNLGSLQMKVDPRAEWRQIFYEAWRLQRDFFYDPNMHGVNWEQIKKRYEVMLPHIAHREDLTYLIGEMIGELNCSHTNSYGGDYPGVRTLLTGFLGCDFEPDKESGYYKFGKIYKGENWSPARRAPLSQPGLNINDGDYLLAINGRELRYPDNPWSLLENTVTQILTLKVNSEPKAETAREVIVRPVATELPLRYMDWVENNRKKVSEATDGRVGYIHLPDTGISGWEEFSRGFYAQVQKEGLIIDVRYNSGGLIPDFFLERLNRKLLSGFATRHTKGFLMPAAAQYGPKVCITNGYSASGGDAFPFYFRKLGLGPLVGTLTWGGLVGVSGLPRLMDNGVVMVPDLSIYNTEGEWDVESKGVAPDIEIDNRPDLVISGRDPQLEKAIEVVLQKLKDEPSPIPEQPKEYPKRN